MVRERSTKTAKLFIVKQSNMRVYEFFKCLAYQVSLWSNTIATAILYSDLNFFDENSIFSQSTRYNLVSNSRQVASLLSEKHKYLLNYSKIMIIYQKDKECHQMCLNPSILS